MSNNYYFSHDYNARNDVKLQKVLKVMGLEGIGLYWCLVEMLYENGGVLELSECDSYAFALRTDTQKILQIIDLVFEKKQSTFTSASVMRRLRERIQKSKKASKSANKRWEKEYAKAMRSHCDRNATNQTKPNQTKGNIKGGSGGMDSLNENDFLEIATKYQVTPKLVKQTYDQMVNWCKSKGKTYKDYKAALMNWIRRRIDEKPDLVIKAPVSTWKPEYEALAAGSAPLEQIQRRINAPGSN